MSADNAITGLLDRWKSGDRSVESELINWIHPTLRELARAQMRRQGGSMTLQATELANEAYVRLIKQQGVDWQNRDHFAAISATVLRRVLIDYLRERQAEKRGGGVEVVTIGGDRAADIPGAGDQLDWLALDQALNDHPRGAASTEAAGRIMSVAEVTGNSFGCDNAYWSQASEKHIAHCIELFRQVEGPLGRECSVNEIQRFTSNEQFLKEYLGRLKDVIRNKQLMGANDYEILLLRNLEDYFTGEWMVHDPKTKGNIQSCVTNLFGDVTRSAQLLKTFCQPSRFSFEDCLNNGKVYTLVLSAYPNAQMLIGTCMKLDFQQVVLKRTQAAPDNKNRFLLFLADEYQFFITTSGGGGKSGGDEKFLSLSRQSPKPLPLLQTPRRIWPPGTCPVLRALFAASHRPYPHRFVCA